MHSGCLRRFYEEHEGEGENAGAEPVRADVEVCESVKSGKDLV